MAYTLAKAVEDLNNKLGIYDSYGWQYKHLKKVNFQHPLDYTLLKSMWTKVDSDANPLFVGSVFKSIFDLSEPTSAYFSTDSELNQSVLFGKKEL